MKNLKNLLFGKQFEKQIAFVGLQNAGKTTLLKRLKDSPEEEISTKYFPTMGLSMEKIKLGGTEVIAADIGGHKTFRTFWEQFVSKSSAVVFVFDSVDVSKVSEAGEALDMVLGWVPSDSTFLFLANKVDLEDALPLEKIIEELGLKDKIKERPHSFGVYQISALKNIGLEEPIQWLAQQLFGTSNKEGNEN